MSRLTITRGLPASGKTRWAREQQQADPNLWRINRDDLRGMVALHWAYGTTTDEDLLTLIQHRAIEVLLEDNVDVIVDDTNLGAGVVETLESLAGDCGADFHVEDFTWVALKVCLQRDAALPNPVGASVIRRMHDKYLAGAR
jgi:tRNA uridine 5-carbamoylmethylation protein Kti12